MILDIFPGVCCGYLCFRSSDLGQISSCIPLPASSFPLGTGCLTDPPVAKPHGYWWEQRMQGRMADRSVLSQMLDSPPLYIYICARLKCNYSAYVRHTHEHVVRKAYFPRYIVFACVWRDTLSPCNKRKEDGRKPLR